MTASPFATAVTTPFATVATDSSEEDQVTFRLPALAGSTEALRVSCSPAATRALVLFRVTPITGREASLGAISLASAQSAWSL